MLEETPSTEEAGATERDSSPFVAPYRLPFAEKLVRLWNRPYLDVHVVDHCNLRCAGCIHFAPLAGPRLLDLGAYERELTALAAIPGVGSYLKRLCLMGGEPLLHPQLPEVITLTRSYLSDAAVDLCTNGILLHRMEDDFWAALVACDVRLVISSYPIRVDYPALMELAQAHGVRTHLAGDLFGSGGGRGVFGRLALDGTGSQDPAASFVRCPVGGSYLQLRDGRLWPCQLAAHHAPLNERFRLDLHAGDKDSLLLEQIGSTDQIEAFRRRAHPMCRYCDNSRLSVVPWSRSRCDRSEWLLPEDGTPAGVAQRFGNALDPWRADEDAPA